MAVWAASVGFCQLVARRNLWNSIGLRPIPPSLVTKLWSVKVKFAYVRSVSGDSQSSVAIANNIET